MDILKQDGYSIIETLVSFVILGLIVTFTVGVYLNLFHNPKLILKSEALHLASHEMDCVLNNKTYNDTTYLNEHKNLQILRKISREESLFRVDILVFFVPNKTELIDLSAYTNEFTEKK